MNEVTLVEQVYDLIAKGGLPVLFILILYTGHRQIWCWGKELRKMEADRDYYRSIVLESLPILRKSVNALTRSDHE